MALQCGQHLLVADVNEEEHEVPPQRASLPRIGFASAVVTALLLLGCTAGIVLLMGEGKSHTPPFEMELNPKEMMERFEAEIFETDDDKTLQTEETRATTMVSCGNHRAGSCAGCPQGHGAGWCHGECMWESAACIDKPGAPPITDENPFGCPRKDGKLGGKCRSRTASVHLNFMRPEAARRPMWYYNEVLPTTGSTDTYYATNTHGYGYAGVQMLEKNSTHGARVLCSIWDQGDQGQSKAKMEKCGEEVECTGFGGEGTGAKAQWGFHWELRERYAFMLLRRLLPDKRMQHSCWFHAPELQEKYPGGWKHLSTVSTEQNGYGPTFLDAGAFLEQWTHMNTQDLRKAFYGPPFYRNEGGVWSQSQRAKFSFYVLPERVEKQQVRDDYVSAGVAAVERFKEDRIWMSTGGMQTPPAFEEILNYPGSKCGMLPEPLYAFDVHRADLLLAARASDHVEKGNGLGVSCGNHRATACEVCPMADDGKFHGGGWCHGECAWMSSRCVDEEVAKCMEEEKPSEVSCGNHRASSCTECPQGHGRHWCNGQCSWSSGKCVR